jgi:hypothetical protein
MIRPNRYASQTASTVPTTTTESGLPNGGLKCRLMSAFHYSHPLAVGESDAGTGSSASDPILAVSRRGDRSQKRPFAHLLGDTQRKPGLVSLERTRRTPAKKGPTERAGCKRHLPFGATAVWGTTLKSEGRSASESGLQPLPPTRLASTLPIKSAAGGS